jgi:hypothetical protein
VARKSGRAQLPFTNGFYQSRSRPLSDQQCVNWYPQEQTNPALSPSSLFATPGIQELITDLDGVGRGAHVWNNVLYVVCGSKLYRIDRTVNPEETDTLTPVEIGTILGNVDVIMVSIKAQLCILVPDITLTAAGNAYIYNGSSLTDVTAAANFLEPAISVVAVDSYFLFAQYNTRYIFHSNLNDGTVYNAVDAWEIQQFPNCVGLMVYQNQVYAMGEYTTVPFYNADELEFAFRPIPNSVIDTGLAGQYALTLFRGSFVYLGSGENAERSVWLFNGGQPEKLSDNTVDFVIQNQTPEAIESARIIRHSQNGAEFVVLYIGNYCFIYDLVSGKWHERRSLIPYGSDELDVPWRAKHIVQAYNRVIVTDSNGGNLGVLDDSIHSEYGNNIHSFFISQPFLNGGNRIRTYAIEVYCDVGNAPGETLQLSYSDDGGFNWSETISREIGGYGEYGRRVVFDRLGAVPNTRMIRIDYTGSKPLSINAIMANTL